MQKIQEKAHSALNLGQVNMSDYLVLKRCLAASSIRVTLPATCGRPVNRFSLENLDGSGCEKRRYNNVDDIVMLMVMLMLMVIVMVEVIVMIIVMVVVIMLMVMAMAMTMAMAMPLVRMRAMVMKILPRSSSINDFSSASS